MRELDDGVTTGRLKLKRTRERECENFHVHAVS